MASVTRATIAAELILPPPYQAVRLREFGDAFAHAVTLAPQRGAGTLVYVGRFDLAEFAVVLEPTDPLAKGRRVFYAGMAALADAIAAAAPPETAIHIEWPDALYVNWALVGGGRLAWPAKTGADNVPEWLVFGAAIRTASNTGVDPGLTPDLTALDEEGFAEISSNNIIEGFARNLMLLLSDWHEGRFTAVRKSYFERLSRDDRQHWDIDDNGDLISRIANDKTERIALLPRLEKPEWLDLFSKGHV
jgi:biotin-(acetyl-CoA carboxylase) ligase